jgi:hypothetical protein
MSDQQISHHLRADAKRPFPHARGQLLGAQFRMLDPLDKDDDGLGVRRHLSVSTHLRAALFLLTVGLFFGGEVNEATLKFLAPEGGVIAKLREKRSRLKAQEISQFRGAEPRP